MRIKLILTFILCSWTFISIGQQHNLDISILKSKVFKEKKDIKILSIKKDSIGNLYVFKQNSSEKKIIVEKFTADFIKINSQEIDTKFGNKIEKFFLRDDVVGFIEYRKIIEKFIVTNYEVNIYTSSLETLNFDKRTLFNVDPEEYSLYKGNMTFLESKKNIIFNITPDNNNGNYKTIVFDKDFNKLWENQFTLPYGDKIKNLVGIKASEDGDVFLLFKIIFNKEKKKEIDNYYHELIKITKDNKLSKKLNLENNLAVLNFAINDNKDVTCLGFYSEKKEDKIKGFCSFILNSKTLSINHKTSTKFSNDFFNNTNGISRNRKLDELTLSDISFGQNGNIKINAQEIYFTQAANNFNTMPGSGLFINTNSTIAHYDDIISIKTNKNGELIWSKNINRKNRLGPTGLYFVSYGLIHNNYKDFIVLNSYKNILGPNKENSGFHENFLLPITKNNSNLYFVEFNKTGNSVCHTILKNKEQEVVYNVENLQQISENEIILYGFKKRKIQYLKITFNK